MRSFEDHTAGRFKPRHLVLHGFSGEIPDQEQAATWFSELLTHEQGRLFAYMKARFDFNKMLAGDGDGEGDYFKHIRIPGAARFAGQIRKLYRSIQD